MFRHTHSLGALLFLSAAPILLACDDDSSILGPDQEAVGQMAFPTAVTLEIGQTIRLSLAEADPDTSKRRIRWTSSDPQVAMVSRVGVVLALAQGTVIITADCGDYSLETKVTVIPAKAG